MVAAAIGEDKAPPGRSFQRERQSLIAREFSQIDIVNEMQIIFGIATMFAH